MVHFGQSNTHTTILRLFGFCRDNPGEPVPEETFTHSHSSWSSIILSASSIYCNPWHPPYSIHVLYSLFPQSLSKFSLVYLLAWYPPLHTPYISSPNHYLLFATHAHTITTCFAVVPRLCHLILVSISSHYLGLYLITSYHTSILPFSSLLSEVPPHFPFLRARSHFHATYCFTRNCYTISFSLSIIGKQRYQLPEFIPNSGLHSCISISVHTQHVT